MPVTSAVGLPGFKLQYIFDRGSESFNLKFLTTTTIINTRVHPLNIPGLYAPRHDTLESTSPLLNIIFVAQVVVVVLV